MKLRSIGIIGGLTFMLCFSIISFIAFMTSYFNPSKTVLILINEYGEAQIEFIIFLLSIPFILTTTYFMIKYEAKRLNIEENN